MLFLTQLQKTFICSRSAANANHQQQQQQPPKTSTTKAGGGASKPSAEQSVKAAMTAVALDKDGFRCVRTRR
jgi:hypothetical protein